MNTCPACQKTGTRMGQTTTLAHYFPTVDADGVEHLHDYNNVTTTFQCPEGHKWTTTGHPPCKAPGCGWPFEKPRVTYLPDEPFRRI